MFILAAQDFVAEENGELVLRFHDDPAMMNDWPEDGVEAATAAKKPPVSATCGTRLPSGRRAGRRGRIDHRILSRRMLEHYSHIRLNAKKAALDRLDESRKTIKMIK